MLQYEYVFEVNHDIIARIYDSEKDESRYVSFSKDQYTPSLFIYSKDGEYKSFTDNTPLKKVTFNKASLFRDYLKSYKDTNFNLYGNTSFVQNFIRTEFQDTTKSDHKYHTWYLDIEVRSLNGFPKPELAKEEITLIQIYDTKIKTFIILGTKEFNASLNSTFGSIKYIKCSDEKSMLGKFIGILDRLNPTAIAGFNSYGFDFPYITNRFQNLGLDNRLLSPVRQIIWSDAKNKDGIDYRKVSWEGRYLLDIQDLYIKYKGANLPRLSLEAISQHELGEGKVVHDEYFSFEEFYNNDYEKYVEYGIKDVELLIQLENKLKFIDTAKYVAYSCGVNVYDVFGTYRQWMSIIFNVALSQNKILPIKAQYTNTDDVYLGGWVFSSPGKHEWVFSFDFASLYPSVIRFLNLGVDTLVKENELNDELRYIMDKYLTYYKKEDEEKIKEFNHNMDEFYFLKNLVQNKEEINAILTKNNVCMSPNGYFYRKDAQSFSSMMMEKFFNQRKIHKKDLKKYEDVVGVIELEIKQRKNILEDNSILKPQSSIIDNELLKTYDDDKLINLKEEYTFKKDKEDLMQYVLKILINSFYGAASMETATFSHGKGYASAVTSAGRFMNRWVAYTVSKKIAAMLNLSLTETELDNIPYLVQADTDSNYITLKDIIIKKFKDNLKETKTEEVIEFGLNFLNKYVEGFIQEAIDEVAFTLNAFNKEVMVMEQETSADKFISIADKRYFCRKWYKDISGHYKNGFKMTGISLVHKSTPTWFKEKLKNIRDIILDKSEKDLIEYNIKVKEDLKEVKDIKDICVIKGVSSVDYELTHDFKANTLRDGKILSAPLHSRGAILHNTLIKGDTRYNDIKAGDKIYYCYLKVPNNVLNHNIISFINPKFIDDYDIAKYVDWETMYEKNYLKNVSNITDPIGWKLNPYLSDIEDWS